MIISTLNIAQSLRELRKRAKLTQKQLSEISKLDVATISRIEIGKTIPTVNTLEKIINSILSSPTFTEALEEPVTLEFSAISKQTLEKYKNKLDKKA